MKTPSLSRPTESFTNVAAAAVRRIVSLSHSSRHWPAAAILLVALTGAVPAQIPQLINYQGRVAVASVNFNGTGQFKFALVDGSSGTTYWSNSPDIAPVDGIPDAAVSLTVAKGLYSVLLGDATLPNMAVVPATVFSHSDVRLRVWFNDGTHGSQQLTPDQRIAAVGYAMMAGNVPDGSITSSKIANGAVTGANIANGSITGSQLASGAAASNLNATGQSGVAGGGVVLSADGSNANLLNAGYLKLGRVDAGDVWEQRAGGSPPSPRDDHKAVWTGSEMIVWGGLNSDGHYFNDGGRYNPAANSWTAVTTTGAPSARKDHSAIWTGSEVIIWGGLDGKYAGDLFNDGARYSPSTNSWSTMSSANAPANRAGHTAVWTGSEMIVWGGYYYYNWTDDYYEKVAILGTGGRYNPLTNSWEEVTATGQPEGRFWHTAVWTDSEMIVWGGSAGWAVGNGVWNNGGRYSPVTNTWRTVALSGAPAGRALHTAVWSGSEMIVWGGSVFRLDYMNEGGRYNPTLDTWTEVPANGAPSTRYRHTAVWTGREMIVWGGRGGGELNDGGIYDPAKNSWTHLAMTGAPAARDYHTAVWTGSEMIVWGGGHYDGTWQSFNDGGRYSPASDSWKPVPSTTGAPTPRFSHSTVWTGSEMIVWGGADPSGERNDGGRYNPAANSWTTVANNGAPAGRTCHTAVWTGREMIVWGGFMGNFTTRYRDGGRYNPSSNTWLPVPTAGAPSARQWHTAVWTGSEMMVWGGNDGAIVNSGGRYHPVTDTWTAIPIANAPSQRQCHTSVWTGTEMIVWGGEGNSGALNDGGRYNPAGNTWSAVPTAGAPTQRDTPTSVWTGSQMIVWGGYGATGVMGDGGRYDPVSNTWSAVTTTGAPAARFGHTAVWTGSEMIIWGGRTGGSNTVREGGRYEPVGDNWTAVTTIGAPVSRYWHTAVWTGDKMIVWGGRNPLNLDDTFSYTPARSLYLYQRP